MPVNMVKIIQTLWSFLSKKGTYLPLVLLLGLSVVVVSSYILSSWMMRPVSDDYNALLAYHLNANWLKILPDTVINGGGRYGQTFVSVIWYGQFGLQGLKLTGIFSVGLFILAGYLAILAWQKTKHTSLNHNFALIGSVIFFMLYTLLSATFAWVRGPIDNTFQDFLWLPGFITYTLPLELLVILTASVILHTNKLKARPFMLIPVGMIAIFIGTFSEIIPMLYVEALCIVAIYLLATKRFRPSHIKVLTKSLWPFVVIGVGLVSGLLLNYVSAATAERKAKFVQAAPLDILIQSIKYTGDYLSTYIISTDTADHRAILLTVVAGIAICLFVLYKFNIKRSWALTFRLGLLCLIFAIMTISSIFICFAVMFKGYGIAPYSYLLPRFEILYNVWFCMSCILAGAATASALFALLRNKHWNVTLPTISLLILAVITVSIPYILSQASYRLRIVANFSTNWQDQDALLRRANAQNIDTVTIPVIDLGDSYDFSCDNSSASNWLGAVKQRYYDIPKVCALSE